MAAAANRFRCPRLDQVPAACCGRVGLKAARDRISGAAPEPRLAWARALRAAHANGEGQRVDAGCDARRNCARRVAVIGRRTELHLHRGANRRRNAFDPQWIDPRPSRARLNRDIGRLTGAPSGATAGRAGGPVDWFGSTSAICQGPTGRRRPVRGQPRAERATGWGPARRSKSGCDRGRVSWCGWRCATCSPAAILSR
jgi:hypothetical protein